MRLLSFIRFSASTPTGTMLNCSRLKAASLVRSGHLTLFRQAVWTNTKRSAATLVASAEEIKDAKPFSSIPGPISLPYIYNLYLVPTSLLLRNNNETLIKVSKKYGSIMKNEYGPNISDSLISLSDAEDVEKLHRLDGTEPRRVIMESWESWREESGYSKGVLIENDGPVWRRMRLLLNKQMLRPRLVASYAEELGEVTRDFVERIKKLRDSNTNAVKKMDMELFHWSLESIGAVLYETRFGGLSDERTEEMAEFIQAVHDMFSTTNYCFFLPRAVNKKVIPKLQNLQDKSWEIIFRQGQKEIDKRFKDIKKSVEDGKEITGFLSTLLATGEMSMDEIYGNISELMAAAVDTTSNTMQWMLYELACHPELQHKIRQEVLSFVPRGQMPTYDEVQRMTYLKGFVKEILRLYPVANVVTRITNNDIVLGGYHIPPNVRILGMSYAAGRNPKYFHDPEKIIPERWQRSENNKKAHPYAWMAFGFGSRMCIGRRIAELEIYLLTSTLLQEFEILPAESKPNRAATKPLLVPERPVFVKFVDRPT